MKKYLMLGCFILVAACASLQKESVRGVATSDGGPTEVDDCMTRFSEGQKSLVMLVGAHPKEFPAQFTSNLQTAIEKTKVECVTERAGPYGVKVNQAEGRITMEDKLLSTEKLFHSDLGRASMEKYRIDFRSVYLSRITTAFAAHAYAEVMGVADAQYDLFFKTLKLLEY